jgi:hypothetical protein
MKKVKQASKQASWGKFCLLRWIQDEEQVSVVLSSSIRSGQICYVGGIGEFKWQSQYYEAEILKVSGRIKI